MYGVAVEETADGIYSIVRYLRNVGNLLTANCIVGIEEIDCLRICLDTIFAKNEFNGDTCANKSSLVVCS